MNKLINPLVSNFFLGRGVTMSVSLTTFMLSFLISIFVFNESKAGMFIYCSLMLLITCVLSLLIENRNASPQVSKYYFAVILIAMTMMIILSGVSFFEGWRSSYFLSNPLWSVDAKNMWHQDTAFNISLINGIINWGYPTIGIDGHRPTAYHVLSHYVDAVLLSFSGLTPYTSYVFTSFIKACFFVNAIFILAFKVNSSIRNGVVIFLVSAPLIIASWHSIGSHALWFTSFLLIFTSSFAYRIIFSEDSLSKIDSIKLLVLCVLLCTGKISTGFSFVCIVFGSLFFKNKNNINYYILGGILCVFIFFYQKFINYSYGIGSKIELSELTLKNYLISMTTSNYAIGFLAIISALCAIYALTKDKSLLRLAFGLISSHIVVTSITIAFTTFNINDRYYFFLGEYSVAILLFINALSRMISNSSRLQTCNGKDVNTDKADKRTVYFLLIAIGFYVPQPLLSADGFSLKRLDSQISLIKSMHDESRKLDDDGKLSALNSFVNDIANDSNIHKRDIGIFIPKDVIENQIIKDGDRRKNFYTMNIFAATGAQIISGFISGERAYGLANYDANSSVRNDIDLALTCRNYHLKTIIYVRNYTNKIFAAIPCE